MMPQSPCRVRPRQRSAAPAKRIRKAFGTVTDANSAQAKLAAAARAPRAGADRHDAIVVRLRSLTRARTGEGVWCPKRAPIDCFGSSTAVGVFALCPLMSQQADIHRRKPVSLIGAKSGHWPPSAHSGSRAPRCTDLERSRQNSIITLPGPKGFDSQRSRIFGSSRR